MAEFRVFPRLGQRPCPAEVPKAIADDFQEAAITLEISPKASAALSRRCLQAVLHDKGFRLATLEKEIDAAVASPGFPSTVAELLHTVRKVGNVAAHPSKEHDTGKIIDVEPGEADLLLEVLSDLFDHYYVKPARNAAKVAAITQKHATKSPPKGPPATPSTKKKGP